MWSVTYANRPFMWIPVRRVGLELGRLGYHGELGRVLRAGLPGMEKDVVHRVGASH